jgi:alanyl-tRNA synthetase
MPFRTKRTFEKAAQMEASDWVELLPGEESVFVGYDVLEIDTQIVKYRKVEQKARHFTILFYQTLLFMLKVVDKLAIQVF